MADEDEDDQQPEISSRLGTAYGHVIAVPLLVVLAGLAFVLHRGAFCALVIGAWVAMLPIVIDTAIVPRFRRGADGPKSVEVPVTAFFIAAGISLACTFGIATHDVGDADREVAIGLAGVICSAVAGGATIMCVRITRERRALCAKLLAAPALASPPVEGAWGSIDGVLRGSTYGAGRTNVIVAVGAEVTRWGDDDNPNFSEEPFTQIPGDITVVAREHAAQPRGEASGVRVDLKTAAWLTLLHVDQRMGTSSIGSKMLHAEIIRGDTPIRVLGRMHGGKLAGDKDMPVVALAARKDAARAIRRIRGRDLVSLGFAIAGLLAIPASVVILVH
jgi:hypothetical protein